MIAPETSYHYGYRTFLYMAFRRLKYPVICIVLMIFISFSISHFHVVLVNWETSGTNFLKQTAKIIYDVQKYGWFFTSALTIFLILSVAPEYHGQTFRLGTKAFYMRSGVLTYEEVALPYGQIKSFTITETASRRMLGLCSLYIVTSGAEKGEAGGATLELIPKRTAHELEAMILGTEEETA